jgi:hypothetical protein
MSPELTRFNIQALYTEEQGTTYQIVFTVDDSHGSQFDLGNANAFYLRPPEIDELNPWDSFAHLAGFCSGQTSPDNYKGLNCMGLNEPEKVQEVKSYRGSNGSDQIDFELIDIEGRQ